MLISPLPYIYLWRDSLPRAEDADRGLGGLLALTGLCARTRHEVAHGAREDDRGEEPPTDRFYIWYVEDPPDGPAEFGANGEGWHEDVVCGRRPRVRDELPRAR